MDRNVLVPVMALSMVNGIFSPFMLIVAVAHWFWYPGTFLPATPQIIAMLSSIIFATLTMMVAGIPAAIYERVTGNGSVAGIIWIVVTALLTLPALGNVMRTFGLG